jgi:hypothetical protein
MKKKNKKFQKTIDEGLSVGTEAASAVISSSVGSCMGGPLGAIAGVACRKLLGDLIPILKGDFENRFLSEWERERINITAAAVSERIQLNNNRGCQVRNDDFFKCSFSDRSTAYEIFEGTFIAAKNEHEEKKLNYYGNLVANIAFHPEIDRYHANYLLRIAERLSYSQICLLTLFQRKSNYNLSSNFQELRKTLDHNQMIIVREIEEIKILHLLQSSEEAMFGGGPAGNITPATTELSDTGKIIHTMMNLDEIDGSEIDRLAGILTDPV